MENRVITLTIGCQSENHAGMQKIGNGLSSNGFSTEYLKEVRDKFTEDGINCELINLKEAIDENNDTIKDATILVIRNGLSKLTDPNEIFSKLLELDWDTKAWMRGRVVNKRARYNLCFAENSQEPDYENKKGRVIAYDSIPLLKTARDNIPNYFGSESQNLEVEGNYYYDKNQCGIGFHGDGERKKVIGIRLGATMPLHYQWFYKSEPVGSRVEINLNHGDMYIMSEKTTGFDWKKRNSYTLRHAAGCEKYLTIK